MIMDEDDSFSVYGSDIEEQIELSHEPTGQTYNSFTGRWNNS